MYSMVHILFVCFQEHVQNYLGQQEFFLQQNQQSKKEWGKYGHLALKNSIVLNMNMFLAHKTWTKSEAFFKSLK